MQILMCETILYKSTEEPAKEERKYWQQPSIKLWVTEWFEPQRIEKFYLDFKMNFFICTDEFFLGMISIEEFPKLTQSF